MATAPANSRWLLCVRFIEHPPPRSVVLQLAGPYTLDEVDRAAAYMVNTLHFAYGIEFDREPDLREAARVVNEMDAIASTDRDFHSGDPALMELPGSTRLFVPAEDAVEVHNG